MKRPLNLLLTVLLPAGLGFGIYVSVRGQIQTRSVVMVRGVIGSEKEDFFRDPQVVAALLRREIAGRNLSGLDFAFPAGVPAAEALRNRVKPQQIYDVFYTPLVVASVQPILSLLEQNGLAKGTGSYGSLDMPALLRVMEAGTRWNALKEADAYPSSRSLLVTTTAVRTSNSAAMYLAFVSNLLNGGQVAQASDLAALMPRVAPLFLRQGYQESSSAGPFEDDQALGAGKTPLVNVYESQYLAAAREKALPAGARLGEALTNDPELQRFVARAGYRTRDASLFQDEVKASGVHVPHTLLDTADLSSQEMMEAMISNIQAQYPK